MCIETVFNYKDKRGEDLYNTTNYAVVQIDNLPVFSLQSNYLKEKAKLIIFPHLKMTEIKGNVIFIKSESHNINKDCLRRSKNNSIDSVLGKYCHTRFTYTFFGIIQAVVFSKTGK